MENFGEANHYQQKSTTAQKPLLLESYHQRCTGVLDSLECYWSLCTCVAVRPPGLFREEGKLSG